MNDCWIVHYRRYSSDEWSERVFHSKYRAVKFRDDYLYDRGFEAQATIEHFVKAAANSVPKDSEGEED